jgi:hypothetical protein
LSVVHDVLAADLGTAGWKLSDGGSTDSNKFYVTRESIEQCLVVEDYRGDAARFRRGSVEFRNPTIPSKIDSFATVVLLWPIEACPRPS